MGGLYTSDESLDYEDLYCEECGDSDSLIGYAETREKAWDLLKDDTDIDGRDGFDVVQKYIEIINPANDNSGSEIDNIKHLYGATLLCLRAHPDNAALQLLLTYCITVLGAGDNETLKMNAYNNYIDGFMTLYQNANTKVWEYIDQFNHYLASQVRDDDDYIREKLIKNGKKMITLFVHEEKIKEIANKYLNK